VSSFGDVDGDDLPEVVFGCPLQPPPNPLDPDSENEFDLGLSVFLGGSLETLGAGPLEFADRDFAWAPGQARVPHAAPFAALGDVDGDGFGDAGIVAYAASAGSVSVRVLAGGPGPFADIDAATSLPPFFPGDEYPTARGVQLAPAGPFPGQETAALWLRQDTGTEARIGLLADVDPSGWAAADDPPVVVWFTPPGGADILFDWRFGLGGPGDADGDGIDDLLVLSGFEDDDGCTAESCGGAWLVLCGDLDGDGVSACAGDCDDADPLISPRITERCDDIDHDCDGDDGQTDGDGDGFLACEGDCDDADPARFPGANETCSSPGDLDCDGLAPIADSDGDGTINCEDCQPWNPALHPGAEEICDGLDTDCDGSLPEVEQDIDRDGWRACSEGGALQDCDDRDALVHPFRFEDCTNGLDDDCNGEIDEDRDDDGDGVRTCDGDCDDGDATVFPGAAEECDGLDNNCNGVIDDARDFDGDGFSVCQGDCDNHDPAVFPGAVGVCEAGLDSNCDGLDDLADFDGDGFTACSGDCDETDEGVAPTAQDWCDRQDNDCDGGVDEPYDLDQDSWADCLGDCADGTSGRFPRPREAVCNDLVDDDCDGDLDDVDTDCPPPPEVEFGPRPYGLSCRSSTAGGGGASALMFGLLLLLIGPRGRRGRRPAAPGAEVLGAAVLVAALGLTGPAEGARKEPGLVIYMSPQPDLGAMVAARDLAALEGLLPEEVLHTSELLEGQGDDRLLVLDSRIEWRCEMDGPPPVLGSAVDEALDALINLDPKRALRTLDVAIAALPCLQSPMPRRIAQNLFYYRGVANLQAGDDEAAVRDFERALAIQLDYPGDANFPPDIAEAFEAVRTTVAALEPVVLHAFAPGSTEVRLDGVPWDLRAGVQDLRPGLHVIQFRRGRSVWTTVVELSPGSRPVVIHSGDQERALRDCVLDPAARAFVSWTLGFAAADAGVEIAALVDLLTGEDEVRWLYRESDDVFSFEEAWLMRPSAGGRVSSVGRPPKDPPKAPPKDPAKEADPAAPEREVLTPSPRRTGSAAAASQVEDRVRFRISGGFAWIHPFPYALIPLDFGVRLVAGLFLDVGVEAAIAAPSDHGTVILPTVSAGFSYRFGTPVFQPRVGAVARLALDDAATDGETIRVTGGWAARVGFDLVPEGNFLFGLDVQAGMYKLGLYVGGSAGAGFRF
jgi:hypothetical protein